MRGLMASQLLLLLLTILVQAEVLIKIPRAPTERMTSIAVNNNTVFLTLLDLSKESGENGRIKSFKTDSTEFIMREVPSSALSPISVRTDKCQRLWVLDSGVQNISGAQNKEHHPQLKIFNLKNVTSVITHTFPGDILNSYSFLATFAVSVPGSCNEAIVYIADLNGNSLIVFDLKTNSSRQIKHQFFSPDPLSHVPLGMIYNKKHQDMNGLFGLAVRKQELLFHPLASTNEFIIATKILNSPQEHVKFSDISILEKRPTEAGTSVYDENSSVMFYAEFQGIGCLGKNQVYSRVLSDADGLIADIAIYGQYLFALKNNDQYSIVLRWHISELIENTDCVKAAGRSENSDQTAKAAGSPTTIVSNILVLYAILRIFL